MIISQKINFKSCPPSNQNGEVRHKIPIIPNKGLLIQINQLNTSKIKNKPCKKIIQTDTCLLLAIKMNQNNKIMNKEIK